MSPDYAPSRDVVETAWQTFAAQRFGDVPPVPAYVIDFVQKLVELLPEPEPEVQVEYETVYETEHVEASHIAIAELLHDLDHLHTDRHAIVEAWLEALQT